MTSRVDARMLEPGLPLLRSPPVDTRATAASVGREQPHPGRLEESIEMDGNGNALSLAVHERMAAQAIT